MDPINPHAPNSSWVNCLVTTSVKITPVKTLSKDTANEIKPEYVTRIPVNITT